ncbi:MAG: CaiB/BaiF CoA transferase family protein, partial [Anaerolineae bacterium]
MMPDGGAGANDPKGGGGPARARGPGQGADAGAGPLAGVRVLDLTSLLPGPFACQVLADLGADVVKVESRLGDVMRQVPPLVRGRSAFYLSLNRNKRSLGLNLRKPRARQLFMDLAARSDVVVEGFRPGRADRMGVGPKAVQAGNPRLVYCSLSGYGQSGPDRNRPGHDITYLARSGLLGLWRGSDGRPVMPPVQVADMAAGLTAALAVCAALFDRSRTGGGRYIDVAILDSIAAWLGFHLEARRAGAAESAGEAMPLSGRYPFYNLYETADGAFVALGALEPVLWRDFCQAVGRHDLVGRQFARGEERQRLFAEMGDLFRSRPAAAWRRLFKEKGLAAEVVADIDAAMGDPQLVARGIVKTMDHPVAGTVAVADTPIRMSGSSPNPLRSPPDLGADTRAVLTEVLDLSAAEIDNLVAKRVVFEATEPGRRVAPRELP